MQTWWIGDNELDEDQQAIMELSPDGSFAVTGPPGSGKTNLLLMRGAYLSGLSRNIAILVMNRTLANFIKTGAAGYGVSSDAVMTSRQFIGALASESGFPLSKDQGWEEGRAEALAALKRVREAKGRPIYDTILIDEAQDHNEEELGHLRALAHDVFLTADARQLIYSNGSRDDRFGNLVNESKELRFHYRSAPEICDLADSIGDKFSLPYSRIAPTCRYPASAPRAEISVVTANLERQGEMIADRLAVQLRAYRGELIGVFTPNRKEAERLAQILFDKGFEDRMTVQVKQDGYMEMRPDRPICISTVHGAKGLEFRAVHFAAAETVRSHRENQKRLAFTGVTRAKTALTVYHDAPLPPFLEAALGRWRASGNSKPDWRKVFSGG